MMPATPTGQIMHIDDPISGRHPPRNAICSRCTQAHLIDDGHRHCSLASPGSDSSLLPPT